MSCLFSTPEQPPQQVRHDPRLEMTPDAAVMAASLGNDINWLASSPNGYADGSSNEDDPILISPFQNVFPKREMFDTFDLSRIPLSLFTGAMPASSASGSAELGSAFTPESISPTTLTPASSSSSISLGNQLGFDAATFGQTADVFGSTPPIADTQTSSCSSSQPELQLPPPAMANEQSIRAPMNILSGEDRLPSSNNTEPKQHQKDSPAAAAAAAAITTPPNRKLSLPQPLYQTPKHTPRKRKSTGSTPSSASSRSSSSPPPPTSGSGVGGSSSSSSSSPTASILGPRKSTHNMIEKRYRTNINEKIAALRDAVPSLRLMVQRMEREGQSGFLAGGGSSAAALLGHGEGILMDDADVSSLEAEQHLLGGLAPAHKLNKATVLSKATEYIAHLERNNAALSREVGQLRNRLTDVEVMLMHQPHPQQQQQQMQQQQQQQQRSAAMAAFGGGMW